MKIIKALWIGAISLVLLVTLYSFDGKPNSDIGVFLAWSGLLLSFPAGLVVSLTHVALYKFFSISIETSHLSLVLDWAGFFILGYLQWFKLVPYLVTKIRARKKTIPA
jgi:hypothetical protein